MLRLDEESSGTDEGNHTHTGLDVLGSTSEGSWGGGVRTSASGGNSGGKSDTSGTGGSSDRWDVDDLGLNWDVGGGATCGGAGCRVDSDDLCDVWAAGACNWCGNTGGGSGSWADSGVCGNDGGGDLA